QPANLQVEQSIIARVFGLKIDKSPEGCLQKGPEGWHQSGIGARGARLSIIVVDLRHASASLGHELLDSGRDPLPLLGKYPVPPKTPSTSAGHVSLHPPGLAPDTLQGV